MTKIAKLDQKDQFIGLRAKEVPYEQIALQLGVSKPTLIKWGKDMEIEISNRRALELEALQDKYYVSKKKRVEFFGEQLNRLYAELQERDLSEIPTERLFDLTMKTMASLKQEETPINLKEKKSLQDSLMDAFDETVVEWRA
ncbi:hypothetical protein ACIQYG_24200 [Peribacillus sp. NPDC096622]|uniref:hypothetical protein n=1 Tax=Peribacillus sp. NPDC096622 TaxID=3364396 RepID=UPI0038118976